jgi:hypothetical protein
VPWRPGGHYSTRSAKEIGFEIGGGVYSSLGDGTRREGGQEREGGDVGGEEVRREGEVSI